MTSDEPDDNDGVPWASPEIRLGYEAALGRFMLEFNQVDNLLGEIIATVLARLKREDLVKKCASWPFWQKLLVLDLLKSSAEGAGLQDVPVPLLTEIATERNRLAHGHFDQNPFSGDYGVVVKTNTWDYSVETLKSLTEKTTEAWMALRYAEAHYSFSDGPE